MGQYLEFLDPSCLLLMIIQTSFSHYAQTWHQYKGRNTVLNSLYLVYQFNLTQTFKVQPLHFYASCERFRKVIDISFCKSRKIRSKWQQLAKLKVVALGAQYRVQGGVQGTGLCKVSVSNCTTFRLKINAQD